MGKEACNCEWVDEEVFPAKPARMDYVFLPLAALPRNPDGSVIDAALPTLVEDYFSEDNTMQKRDVREEGLTEDENDMITEAREDEPATHKTDIVKHPEVLAIQLSRRFTEFKDGAVVETKLENAVSFEETLVLKDIHHQDVEYKLYAISAHIGGKNSGHYTAYIKKWTPETHEHEWYLANDSTVTRKELSKDLFKKAYVLFYRRLKTRAYVPLAVREEATKSLEAVLGQMTPEIPKESKGKLFSSNFKGDVGNHIVITKVNAVRFHKCLWQLKGPLAPDLEITKERGEIIDFLPVRHKDGMATGNYAGIFSPDAVAAMRRAFTEHTEEINPNADRHWLGNTDNDYNVYFNLTVEIQFNGYTVTEDVWTGSCSWGLC